LRIPAKTSPAALRLARQPPRNRYVGAETDVFATYNFTRHLLGYAGYSHFLTGEFIDKTGKNKDSDFYYVAIQFTF